MPLLLQMDSPSNGKLKLNKPFRFENFWLTIAGFKDLIMDWRNKEPTTSDPASNLILKLPSLRSHLKAWNQSHVGNILLQKDKLLHRIDNLDVEEETRNLSSAEKEERIKMKEKLDTLLYQEETLWKQRAHIKWLRDGDQNTKLFHLWASNRKRKNLILDIYHQRVPILDNRQIHDCFREHFKQLLGNSEQPCITAN
ncbi:hypothetical protein COCNU_08G010480 [Cocos nucifera]|uniref:Uncharacterized protein n=1 Tax=Cocos nucifera TaxID=13894 RepID=A0A8K0IJ53_COCNU|nr:hypothetical protein COCNU_08G010480 [Cocos nucifera]